MNKIKNSLQSKFPEIAAQWHPTKNGDLTSDKVSYGSHKKVWWWDTNGHEWQASIHGRTAKNKSGCPYCSHQKVHYDNCLSTLHPELAKQWHPTKNGDLTPKDVVGGKKKHWWVDKKGHEWQATIDDRINGGTGCPFCVNHIVCNDNSLQTLYPEIAKQWHPTRNGDLTPDKVVFGSHKKVWWLCGKEHAYLATISKRTHGKRGCPFCANKKVCDDNCLQTKFSEVAKEWHPTKNGRLTPKDVLPGSHKKVWWLCKKGHAYWAAISERTHDKGCSYCAGKKACSDNCLANLFPEIAKEWHSTLNGNLTTDKVLPGSDKKRWWQCCKKGHIYQTTPNNRTNPNTRSGCPICSESKGEKKLEEIFTKLNITYIRQYRHPEIKNIKPLPFDFYLPDFNCLVEFHGHQHYKPINWSGHMTKEQMEDNLIDVKQRDKIKRHRARELKIPYLAINYKQIDEMEGIIKFFMNNNSKGTW